MRGQRRHRRVHTSYPGSSRCVRRSVLARAGRAGVDHAAVCAANEAWLRSEISRGSHVIDIGIDASRLGSRSPYYELEQRVIAENGLPGRATALALVAEPVRTRRPRTVSLMTRQEAGKWTTPYGPNARYTVRLHVVGEDRNESGSVRAVDRHVEYGIVTPLGELKAAATAAVHFTTLEPGSIYSDVEIVKVEHDFTIDPFDYRDRESFGR